MKTIAGSCHCGKIKWEFLSFPESDTACNCTVCRRYGALWAYGFLDENVRLVGDSEAYRPSNDIDFHSCPVCACLTHYVGVKRKEDGRLRAVVNLRMASNPDQIGEIRIRHFGGFESYAELPSDGKCVKDLWF
jgi:hypothetical protein